MYYNVVPFPQSKYPTKKALKEALKEGQIVDFIVDGFGTHISSKQIIEESRDIKLSIRWKDKRGANKTYADAQVKNGKLVVT